MTRDPNRLSDANDQFIESLLQEAYDPGAEADDARIDRLMEQIRDGQTDPSATVELRKSPLQSASRWGARLAIAACVLIVCGYAVISMSGSHSAYAAVLRAIEVNLPTREYRVQMTNRWPVVGERDVTAKLYVNNRDEFCVWHPGWLPGGEIWVGGDLDSRWIVPRVGPIVTGDEDLIASALQGQGLGTPMLHLRTLLTRMSEDYDLRLLADEDISNPRQPSESIRCQHVTGVRAVSSGMTPIQIDLWANRETGVAERVELVWPQDTEAWLPLRWRIDLIAFPELADNWFEFQGHSEPGRIVMPMPSGISEDPPALPLR
ncbi:hypothetical protein FF011L_07610 [Roseimaritima multifibrata]|uniref:Uncharacterized protein n=1 Tax=Roseimaritima multifibrata TaxID=1930274 RepID=A0A517MAX1_9BACT|nr:hypothetical protein [Roseimaritima multifibrata]QDS92025.1 hypothetical protein FF011L_07610 [Roseimaritima multifibrata]